MKRRTFLTQMAAGAAATAMAAPALAQGAPSIKWRMATSWPKSLDTIYGSAAAMCKRISELTDGKFEVTPFAGGEIVGATQVMDATKNKTVECSHTLTSFFTGKNPAYAFDGGIAYGMNARQQNAWYYEAGGKALIQDLFGKENIVSFPCGNTGVQMGGWYRKEIKAVEDLNGLKMRIGGLGGRILAKLGVVAQQIPPGDIYPSLERGTIDAAEWIGPYDDEKLGFAKVAKYYYTPGWWEGSAQITALANKEAWDSLPPLYKTAFETAATEQNLLMLASYDAKNPEALKRLLASGVELRAFPQAVMDATFKATVEVFNEIAASNPDFKKIYEPWRTFLNESNAWMRLSDYRLDSARFAAPKWA